MIEPITNENKIFLEEFFCTFGCNQEYEGFYAKVKAFSKSEAKEKIEERFGKQYSMLYSTDEWNKIIFESHLYGFPLETELFVIE